jgi:hypothetical protein
MYQELSDRLGAYDATISNDLVKLKRWLNMAQQYICGKRLWPFMLAQEIIQTTTDVTTGTVAVTAGGTALTFSSGPVASVANRYIQFSTSQDWYKITAHTAAATAATISPAYVGTSDLTAGTFTIRKLLYSTSTPLIQILDMKQLISPARLIGQAPASNDFFLPLYHETGTPNAYIPSSPTTAGAIQFSLNPSPDAVMNIMVRGKRVLSDLSAAGDESIIPSPWHDAIINIAAHYGFSSLDDTRAKDELLVGESRIEDMSLTYSHDLGRHRVQGETGADIGLSWVVPSNLGPIQ